MCYLLEMSEYWELRICGYTFQYVHHRPSGYFNNWGYVKKEKYETFGCKKISSSEAALMLLEALEKGVNFHTENQKEQWELAAAMLTK